MEGIELKNDTISDVVRRNVVQYKDFPIKGVNFVDIFPLFTTPEVGSVISKHLVGLVKGIAFVPESRGFLFVSMLNSAGIPVVVLRKANKLPHNPNDLIKVSYKKEYGTDHLFYRKSDLYKAFDSVRITSGNEISITILDDILATGGTALAIHDSLLSLAMPHPFHIKVKKFLFISEINSLKGRLQLESCAPVESLSRF